MVPLANAAWKGVALILDRQTDARPSLPTAANAFFTAWPSSVLTPASDAPSRSSNSNFANATTSSGKSSNDTETTKFEIFPLIVSVKVSNPIYVNNIALNYVLNLRIVRETIY